jgi:WD40 repeat protein
MPVRTYEESHTDTVTQLAFHPTHENLLLSGSTDGLVSIFDVEQAEEEDALQQVLNPRSAVHCAGFIAEDQVYVVSTDEQYSIHTLAKTLAEDEQVPPPIEFGDMRERLKCTYVIDVLLQSDGPPLMAHGHTESGTLALTSMGNPKSWELGQSISLAGAHGEEIVRDVLLADGRAYTCGEDGTVKVWSLGL